MVEEFFHLPSDNSGMNYQQRNRALSEGIRERCQRTGSNRNVDSARNADLIPDPIF
jgi:hypothetical protein